MTIPIVTNENIFQYHQIKTQLNIRKGNFQLPIIEHERRPAADVDFIKQLNEDINELIQEYLESQQVDYEKIDYKDLAYNLKYNHCLHGKLEILMEELA